MIAISNDLFADLISLLEDRCEVIEDGDAYNDDDVIRIHDRLLRQKAMQTPQKEITMIDPSKKYQTTSGIRVEIRYVDSERGFLCELQRGPRTYGEVVWVDRNGRLPFSDIVFLVECSAPRQKRVAYINLYSDGDVGRAYRTVEEAKHWSDNKAIARKRIEIDYAEGEFDE